MLATALLLGLTTTAQTTAAFYSLACLITMLISLTWWLRKPGIHWGGVEQFPSATLWQSCLPLWWVAVMGLGVQWAGQLVPAAYVPPEDLAILAVAQRTAMLTSFVLMAVNLVVAPKFAALYKQGKNEQLENIALKATKLMVFFALPIVGFIKIFPERLMWLFGEQYKSGANLLRILALGQFVNVMTGSVGYLLSMSGHERALRNVVFVSGPMAIILALVLTPLYGVTGAAVATAISLASQNLLAVGMVKRRLGFNTLAVWRRTG
ncbi:polysaccharide biosynthesis C-terminal domain-containing protein [Endozoicomonas sp. YOMI1]|uniref:MATE family efflux transporter n=1 Tax=Endozoicomonas sp. YOMI1 TaxID=2828739 RepID=UPI00214955DF|nr:polysaccharide biosynthesis C-terminal domain-containing protein [Endozoicomonas sp. YOMI1]